MDFGFKILTSGTAISKSFTPLTHMLPGKNSDILEPGTPPSTLVPQILATAHNL